MAETLGSLIDKLSIKSIRYFYLEKMAVSTKSKLAKKDILSKLKILKYQKNMLLEEIESFILLAIQGKATLRDQKLKLYNKPSLVGRIGEVTTLARAIDNLTRKNMQLWRLEDEARKDAPLSEIGKVKRKIDFANQQRNDLIDKVDELLQGKIRKFSKSKKRAK